MNKNLKNMQEICIYIKKKKKNPAIFTFTN